MTDYTTQDAVKMAMDGDAKGFQTAINDLMMDRVQDAISTKKVAVASSFMSADSEEEVEIQGDTDGDSEV